MPNIAIGTNGDRTLYGVSDTSDDAIHDAIMNLQADDPSAEPDEDGFDTMSCTEALQVQVLNCYITYVRRNGHAYTAAEAEAVDAGLDFFDEGIATDKIDLDEDDAERLDVEVQVMICGDRMVVTYETSEGVRGEIADEPADPEQQTRAYDYNLRNAYAATVGLLKLAVERDLVNV